MRRPAPLAIVPALALTAAWGGISGCATAPLVDHSVELAPGLTLCADPDDAIAKSLFRATSICDATVRFVIIDEFMRCEVKTVVRDRAGNKAYEHETRTTGMSGFPFAEELAALKDALREGLPLRTRLAQASPASPAVAGPPSAAPATAVVAPVAMTPRFASAEAPDDLAVIVGVESYSDIPAKAPYAERDADAVKSFVRALGVPDRNIVLLKGPKAVKSSLEKYVEGWLPRLAKPSSRVYFYFSGHGAPEIKSGQSYLVPWDGDPNFLEATAYPLPRLYRKLGELPAKQIFVAMDSCFSGAGGRSVLASGARPLVPKVESVDIPANLTVLSAAAGGEIAGSLDDKQHGAFTYFLLDGLNGAARDGAGRVSAQALHSYLTPRVQDEARRLNRDQTPQLAGAQAVLR